MEVDVGERGSCPRRRQAREASWALKARRGHANLPGMQAHPNDPLHGVTLETVLRSLVDRYGWAALAERIPVRCFTLDPTVRSSLTFLRKTPWARQRLEDWYVHDARGGGF